MSTNFPTNLDDSTYLPNTRTTGNPILATDHNNQSDAIIALETKVGKDGSAVTTTHDYKLSGVTGSDKAASKAGAEALTNKTITDSTNNVMAKSLKSATTTVDVSAATAPSSGQVLTATGSTTATWQTPSAGGTKLVVTGDVTNSTQAFADVTGLTWSAVANTTYYFDVVMYYTTAATTTGMYVAVNGPASPTSYIAGVLFESSTGAVIANTDGAVMTTLDAGTGTLSAGAGTGVVRINGRVVNGSNAGTLAIRFCSEVAASAVTIKAGSYATIS